MATSATLSASTARLFEISADPTSSDYEFDVNGTTIPIEIGNFVRNTSSNEIFQCDTVSTGVSAGFEVVQANGLIQTVVNSTSARASINTIIPFDNSIPQITEGTEVLTATITPTNASNWLLITFNVQITAPSAASAVALALFQDSTTNALSASQISGFGTTASNRTTGTLIYTMTSGTTSATTFRIRMGNSAGGGAFDVNGDLTNRLWGGVANTRLIVQELAV